jgi:16S rRNA (guanine966-N2)-methyltransferase
MRIIAGEWRGRRLNAPRGSDVRPTTDRVRESWFSILGSRIQGASVLDLFCGSGALGLEALSRGAAGAVFVDRSRKALQALERNIRELGAEDRARVVSGDALGFVKGLSPAAFDLALVDPPYDRGFAPRVVEAWCTVPFARELWVEHRSSEDLPECGEVDRRRYGDTMLSGHLAPIETTGEDA